ncbi:MAG: hypothetical protein R3B90_01225 [Planctomycetaceae bacterium]
MRSPHRLAAVLLLSLTVAGLSSANSPRREAGRATPNEHNEAAPVATIYVEQSAPQAEEATTGATAERPVVVDLSGEWVMTLPAGWQRKITIARVADGTYDVQGVPALVMNGIYELDGTANHLRMIESNDQDEANYDWELLNANTLLLVDYRTGGGGSYTGATLSRHFEWTDFVENAAVPRVGTKSHGRPSPAK